MDENLEVLLESVFELGFNRGLGRVASPDFLYLQWQDAKQALIDGAPSLENVRVYKV